jgi:UDP-N-acetylglucosamine 2-epimerase (non-hydrolysing)
MRPIAIILGVRPDVIRASLILERLRSSQDIPVVFIWSGQHYSDNLKEVFFRELRVGPPDVELGAAGASDAEIVGKLVPALAASLESLQPQAAVFLGDTNTVLGCLAAAQLTIPVVHIEGCMRSYDWRMPEEKYRTLIDHLSDVIYAYLDEYKAQGVGEGLSPDRIVVTGNPIVDVLNRYYFGRLEHYQAIQSSGFFRERRIEPQRYYLMTCHRRENVHDPTSLRRILDLAAAAAYPVYFPASYRTQQVLGDLMWTLPSQLLMTDPVGYDEFLVLITNARGVLTDSGTVVEEACILQIPSVQMRRSTERPQVYDVGACVKFDPMNPLESRVDRTLERLEQLHGRHWPNPFGDGRASERIADDLLRRAKEGSFDRHQPVDYHLDVQRSYRADDL